MKKRLWGVLGVVIMSLTMVFPVYAGYRITTVAGGGAAVPQAGLLATDVTLDSYASKVDSNGNLYIAEDDYSPAFPGRGFLRVNPFGVIDNVLIDLAFDEYIDDLAVDGSGNVYVPLHSRYCIYKVTPAGVASVYAGTCGTKGYSGDGGPATQALLETIETVAIDLEGNLYFDAYHDSPGVIRKIDRNGIISTLLNEPSITGSSDSMYSDGIGNLYFFAGYPDVKIFKVSAAGALSPITGTGNFGHSGDGGPAINADIGNAHGVASDKWGNVFIGYTDSSVQYVRRIDPNGMINTIYSAPYDGTYVARMSTDGDGTLYLTRYSSRIDKMTFDPEVSQISPAEGTVGQTVTLQGRYFLSRGAGGSVTFGGVPAEILTWNSERITCKVPQGVSKIIPVVVTTREGQASSPVNFRVR